MDSYPEVRLAAEGGNSFPQALHEDNSTRATCRALWKKFICGTSDDGSANSDQITDRQTRISIAVCMREANSTDILFTQADVAVTLSVLKETGLDNLTQVAACNRSRADLKA